jgi:acetyl esterase
MGVTRTRRAVRIPRGVDTPELTSHDAIIELRDRTIPVRLYIPRRAASQALLFFHGGGWMLGDLDTNDELCRDLAVGSGFAVVSVDYRLAPEHPHPAAIHDGLDALQWVADGADGFIPGVDAIAVGGHSAGGNIAAVLAQLSTTEPAIPHISHQLLLCAVLDADTERPSYRQYGEGLLMTTAEMQWYWDLYVPDRARRFDPTASPYSRPNLTGVPAASIVVGGCDTLRDEAIAYANRLRDAGVHVELREVPGVPHLFLTFPSMPCRDDAIRWSADRLRALGTASEI